MRTPELALCKPSYLGTYQHLQDILLASFFPETVVVTLQDNLLDVDDG